MLGLAIALHQRNPANLSPSGQSSGGDGGYSVCFCTSPGQEIGSQHEEIHICRCRLHSGSSLGWRLWLHDGRPCCGRHIYRWSCGPSCCLAGSSAGIPRLSQSAGASSLTGSVLFRFWWYAPGPVAFCARRGWRLFGHMTRLEFMSYRHCSRTEAVWRKAHGYEVVPFKRSFCGQKAWRK
jgi:hypothetical protein